MAREAGAKLRKQGWKKVLGLLEKYFAPSDKDREKCRHEVQEIFGGGVVGCGAVESRRRRVRTFRSMADNPPDPH
eukprot:1140115-Pelagomonas_calceolata.AAC.9